jgi:hypothetical protein
MSGPAIQTSPCPRCGQGRIASAAAAVCVRCQRGQYAGDERHESPRLFEPAPTQLPGQLAITEGARDAR